MNRKQHRSELLFFSQTFQQVLYWTSILSNRSLYTLAGASAIPSFGHKRKRNVCACACVNVCVREREKTCEGQEEEEEEEENMKECFYITKHRSVENIQIDWAVKGLLRGWKERRKEGRKKQKIIPVYKLNSAHLMAFSVMKQERERGILFLLDTVSMKQLSWIHSIAHFCPRERKRERENETHSNKVCFYINTQTQCSSNIHSVTYH